MLIDWYTVGAQIINFLILVFLLSKFLYRPIIRAMEEREARIAGRLREAQDKREEAEREARYYREMQQDLDTRRADILRQAAEEAEDRRRELIREARGDADAKRSAWLDVIEREKRDFLQELRKRTSREVVRVARQVLEDFADAELEERIVDVFIRRLWEEEANLRESVQGGFGRTDDEVVVYSTFELPMGPRDRIVEALRSRFAVRGKVRFESSDDLLCGVEVHFDGRKISWNFKDYLDTLESRLLEAIELRSREGFTEGPQERPLDSVAEEQGREPDEQEPESRKRGEAHP